MQKSLNRDRAQLGLTIAEPLENAPPVLAFTTVALGGFRGLISNYLWIRANDLEQDDKFFEAAQLADWITDLEPHFPQVWAFQAWNMAWNISVKFKDFADRWRWVEHGIELLRDHGSALQPGRPLLLYQQLALDFSKQNGSEPRRREFYYKQRMGAGNDAVVSAPNGTNFSALVHPQTAEERTNALLLREKYKIDPAFAQKVDAQYGPFDWRLPETHAIYWGAMGLDAANKNPDKVKPNDVMTLRRIIYQSMLQSFHHGRYIANPFTQDYSLGPNLDLVPQVNDAYLQMYAEETDPAQRDDILKAHRNFLKDAVYFLYGNNRVAEAAKWYKMLGEKYPDKPILDKDPNSFPRTLTLDEYAVARIQDELGDTSEERTTAVVQGLLSQSYLNIAIGQDDRAAGFKLLAGKVYQHYVSKTVGHGNEARVPLPPFDVLNRSVLNDLLDTQKPVLPYAARAIIRTQLGMTAETNAPAATISTNTTPSAISSTNTLETATNKAVPAALP
jgi:hypothetical protein